MARIDPTLEEFSRQHPHQSQQVVIVLTEESQHLKAADLGLVGAQEIGRLGLLKGTLTGTQILELSQRSEIEEIIPDSEVSAFA